jgi:hypothetical protein
MTINKNQHVDGRGLIVPAYEQLLKEQQKNDNSFKERRKKTNKYASTPWMKAHPRDEHGRWIRSEDCSNRWKNLREKYNYKNFTEFLKTKALNKEVKL